jgi:hypothetical protein
MLSQAFKFRVRSTCIKGALYCNADRSAVLVFAPGFSQGKMYGWSSQWYQYLAGLRFWWVIHDSSSQACQRVMMFHRWLCIWSSARVVGDFGPQVISIKVSQFFRLMARECYPSLSKGEGLSILTIDQTLLFTDLNSSPLFHSRWSRILQGPTVIVDSSVLVLFFHLPCPKNVIQSVRAYTPLSLPLQVLTSKVWPHHRNSPPLLTDFYQL